MAVYQKDDLILDEAKVGAKTSEDWAAQGFKPVDTSKLTSQNLADTTQIPYQTPQASPVYQPQPLEQYTPMEMTKPEQEAQDWTTYLQRLNQETVGESSFRAEQEQTQKLPEFIKTQNDLTSQYNAILNEAKAIPLQMQQDATGRGITAGGLRPLETARLRTNAIQALGVQSLLEASRGNIATAQTLVDRAVAQKFDPIKEQIKAATANLDLIIKSPAYSLADKNRAEAQKAIQEARAAALAQQEEDAKQIYQTALDAAKYGADAETLMKIQNSKTPAEALALASPYLGREYADKQEQQQLANAYMLQEYQDKQIQQAFDNIVTEKKLTLEERQLAENIKQQAFENDVTLEELKLDRSKFANDVEYRNAQLMLDEMKLSQPSKADIVKINGVDYQLNPDGTYTKPLVPAETQQASELKIQAGQSASQLLEMFNKGQGLMAVGKSSIIPTIPGTKAADFKVLFNNVKSLLSLENVKLLKGQGQVSDAERKLLADASAKIDLSQSQPEFKRTLQDIAVALGSPGALQVKDDKTYIYKNMDGTIHKGIQGDNYVDRTKPPAPDFNGVGGDTDSALGKLMSFDNGQRGGQCGRFVNKLTALGIGDSYKSKLAKMDPSIKYPEPGMVFVMPYKDTGHVGFIVGIDGDKAIVKDSNYGLDEKIKTHIIPINKMTGFRKV